ncbi:MAG TPA: inositol monophosphatase family protein [Bacteroidota bacterium]|nr:inositol monophosphatase family protein [Bacteroidota bacterium]
MELLSLAVEAAKEAGAFLTDHVGKIRSIEHKDGLARNLVSEIDKGSEAMIIRRIKARFPDHDVLAEESGSHGTRSEYRWIIDPLDGTTNFLHGVPIFSVTIAVDFKGSLVAGVTFDPTRNEIFTAEKGAGAFLNGARLRVTSASTLIESLMVTGFPYDLAERQDRPLEHFSNFALEAQGIRRLGSAALDLAYVAAGRFDGYWEVSLNPWDVAAGVLLVEEAGGKVTNLKGGTLDLYAPQIVATNGKIHDACIGVIGRVLNRSGAMGAHPSDRPSI